MSLAGIMIFAIAAALTAVLLKQIKSEYSIFLVTGAAIILFLVVLSQIGTVIETIQKIQKLIRFDDIYINILVKITGISYLTQFAADICKDCGSGYFVETDGLLSNIQENNYSLLGKEDIIHFSRNALTSWGIQLVFCHACQQLKIFSTVRTR